MIIDLDEAIKHCKEIYEQQKCSQCGLEHQQLMNWLEELKLLRFMIKNGLGYEDMVNDF
jgi:hypothetical protein